ncbi:hypothetical protein OS493_032907 [Desmophyllum pertusum]|uniref:Spondin domain-containing protein n=1 Tax=Desmophyllum pertusum TaxID=174260 RepID=A0A9X0CJQ4_9CNID|nr:hypothetical protein OS493_032907 [Desmophyllum pertusum]
MWKSGVQSASFPSGAHFSPLIGCTHNYKYKFWSPNTMASPGVQSVAETGATTTLYGELMAVKGKPNWGSTKSIKPVLVVTLLKP